MASASTITAPRSASFADTVDFPEPMPPVNPTTSTGASSGTGRNVPSAIAFSRTTSRRGSPDAATDQDAPPAPARPPARPLVPTATGSTDLLARFGPLVIAIRWGTVAVGLALAALGDRATGDPGLDSTGRLLAFGAPLVAYAAFRTVRPLRYVSGEVTGLLGVLGEVGLSLAVVVATGYWSSPYVFCLASAILAAGFARGFGFAIRTACTAAAAVAIPFHLVVAGSRAVTTVQWGGELLLIALIAGYARVLFGEAEEQSALARQANDLLTQLNAVAQTLPASLDLGETVDGTIAQLRDLFPIDVVAVLLRDEASPTTWSVAAVEGLRLPTVIDDGRLPPGARVALATTQARLTTGEGAFLGDAGAGIYLPLLARDRLIGLIAVESRDPDGLTTRQVELGQGVASQAALALDNARWFSRLRTVGADEERTRIARDLHDRVGQSLAFVSFELDRISKLAKGQPVEPELVRLREDVRNVVTEVRDTLYDLRTDVTERKDLVATIAEFVDRLQDRSAVDIRFDFVADRRLPVRQERELWRIVQEAVTNALRHAGASTIHITWRCDAAGGVIEIIDDGQGLPETSVRADAFGMIGMRERAAAIGARLEVQSPPGTTVRCTVDRTP
jgi:signal transduction histidine kinase